MSIILAAIYYILILYKIENWFLIGTSV